MQAFSRAILGLLHFAWYCIRGWTIFFAFREFGRVGIAVWALLRGQRLLNVVLIKASQYDPQTGFPQQDRRGVLPSNTLATLCRLIRDAEERRHLGRVRIIIRPYDEAVQAIRPRRIARLCRTFPSTSVVMIAGVQTNQFARANDLAGQFRDLGLPVIIGGYHVSGVVAQFPQNGDDVNTRAFSDMGLSQLLARDVSLFAGETEGRMHGILRDVLNQQLLPLYNFLDTPPDITDEPAPRPIRELQPLFVTPAGTIDLCRGCPFTCKFCTIRIFQGQAMRTRSVACFVAAMRVAWKDGIRSFFFTSDNTSRDPLWRERFEALIALQKEGIKFKITIQIDTKAYKIPDFIELAALAGVTYAFVGLESMNPLNLEAIGKRQNNVFQYRELVQGLRQNGIVVHFGYMIGLPFDTRESVAEDVRQLMQLDPDLVSFFNATPLPGADDHREMYAAGAWMDPDLNAFDSFDHPVCHHPRMSREEWQEAYQEAWHTFYSAKHIIAILKRTPVQYYWRAFWGLLWYKHSIVVTKRHPMVSGFFRFYDRKSRRPTFPAMSRWEFQKFSTRATLQMWRDIGHLLREFNEIWLQTRQRGELESRVIAYCVQHRRNQWVTLKIADLRQAYKALHEQIPSVQVPNWWKLMIQSHSFRATRQDLEAHWHLVRSRLRRGRIWVLFTWKTVSAAYTDTTLFFKFLRTLLINN